MAEGERSCDEGAASLVMAKFLEPRGDEAVMAAADGKYALERRRGGKIGLRNPLEDCAIGVEEGNEAIGRGIALLEPFGIDPAGGFAATVFKEDGFVEGWDGAGARARNPGNPCAEGVEDRDGVGRRAGTGRRSRERREGEGVGRGSVRA